MVNVIELRKAMDLVLDASAQGLHEQSVWIAATDCGTAGCFAGLYAVSRGCTPVYHSPLQEATRETAVIRPPGVPHDAAEVTVCDWVAAALGLSKDQAQKLFSMDNSVADLKEIVDALCAGAGE